jgi:N-acetylglucosaminyl-diphospho-decaprenol L-rhamnosyltransferase
MSAVTVIVVNFNAGEHLRVCLQSAAADLDGRDWDAIVIDNASSDGSADGVDALPRVRLVRNAENRGFGSAVNQAAALSRAARLWLLNPDCRVERGAFERLEATLAAHPECAIAAPQLLNADGGVQASARGEPTALTGLFGRHGILAKLLPRSGQTRRNLRAEELTASTAESSPVDWVMGAAMLIRRDAFDLVAGFDERYFLYWEDADLCRRLRDRGLTTRYVPRARVWHPGGVSAASRQAFATRAFHRSAYLYYATHVAPSPLNPMRWFSKIALGLRAWWRISRGR